MGMGKKNPSFFSPLVFLTGWIIKSRYILTIEKSNLIFLCAQEFYILEKVRDLTHMRVSETEREIGYT